MPGHLGSLALEMVAADPQDRPMAEPVQATDWSQSVRVVPAAAASAASLVSLLERCSSCTRRLRFGGPVDQWPRRYLHEVRANTEVHLGVVAVVAGQAVGIASAAAISSYERELAVMVEDSWQRRGVGTAMCTVLVDQAIQSGCRLFHFQTDLTNRPAGKLLRLLAARVGGQLGTRGLGVDGLRGVLVVERPVRSVSTFAAG